MRIQTYIEDSRGFVLSGQMHKTMSSANKFFDSRGFSLADAVVSDGVFCATGEQYAIFTVVDDGGDS